MVSGRAAVVIGAGGGIGGALVERLDAAGLHDRVYALSRTPSADKGCVRGGLVDVTDEDSLAKAAARIGGPVDLVIIATGILHEGDAMPERALRELDGNRLARIFAINAIGPALAIKHFAPLLPREQRSVIAALSARVGSISDNRSGGWYGYRASKAALNMMIKSAAIELARSRPEAICVALHPGTVDTPLSEPFQARVAPEKLFDRARAADQLLAVVDGLSVGDTGGIFAWDATKIAP